MSAYASCSPLRGVSTWPLAGAACRRYGQVAFHYLWDRWRCIPSDSIFKVVKLIHTIMMAEALLEYNANPNIPFPETGMTPLHVAAMYGHAQIAQLILMVCFRRAASSLSHVA